MFPDDPRVIYTLDDLREVGNQMKIAACPDDPLDMYTKTEAEVARVKRLEGLSPEAIRHLQATGANRAIVLDGHFVSLVMSTDDHHGHQWHLSMVDVVGPQQIAQSRKYITDTILKTFFSTWKEIENPGKITEILHFVGND